MSLEQVDAFLQRAAANETLRSELDGLLRARDFSRIVALGAEAGFDFRQEDCGRLLGRPEELSEEDLDAVAGGMAALDVAADSDGAGDQPLVATGDIYISEF